MHRVPFRILRANTISLHPKRLGLNLNPHFPSRLYSSVPLNFTPADQPPCDQLVSSNDEQGIPKSSKDYSKQSVTTFKSSVVTLKTLKELFERQIPITMLTAYDFATARLVGMSNENPKLEEMNESTDFKFPMGIDICLCGDSLANVCLGYQSTNELTIEEYSYHLKSIRRGLDSLILEPKSRIPLLFADLPFGSFESSVEHGMQSATKLIQTCRVDGFKIEGGAELSPLIKKMTSFGIPIMGHIGLTPQRASSLGGFKVQGHDDASRARQIIQDAIDLERSGCLAVVVEAVPIELVTELKKKVRIPIIGIGAGPGVDGQVLVLSDLIGILNSRNQQLSLFRKPKFVPRDNFLLKDQNLNSNNPIFDLSTQIISQYILNVRTRQFPVIGTHTYSMKPEVLAELNQDGWSI